MYLPLLLFILVASPRMIFVKAKDKVYIDVTCGSKTVADVLLVHFQRVDDFVKVNHDTNA